MLLNIKDCGLILTLVKTLDSNRPSSVCKIQIANLAYERLSVKEKSDPLTISSKGIKARATLGLLEEDSKFVYPGKSSLNVILIGKQSRLLKS